MIIHLNALLLESAANTDAADDDDVSTAPITDAALPTVGLGQHQQLCYACASVRACAVDLKQVQHCVWHITLAQHTGTAHSA